MVIPGVCKWQAMGFQGTQGLRWSSGSAEVWLLTGVCAYIHTLHHPRKVWEQEVQEDSFFLLLGTSAQKHLETLGQIHVGLNFVPSLRRASLRISHLFSCLNIC